jgi:hypothetical protein
MIASLGYTFTFGVHDQAINFPGLGDRSAQFRRTCSRGGCLRCPGEAALVRSCRLRITVAW